MRTEHPFLLEGFEWSESLWHREKTSIYRAEIQIQECQTMFYVGFTLTFSRKQNLEPASRSRCHTQRPDLLWVHQALLHFDFMYTPVFPHIITPYFYISPPPPLLSLSLIPSPPLLLNLVFIFSSNFHVALDIVKGSFKMTHCLFHPSWWPEHCLQLEAKCLGLY